MAQNDWARWNLAPQLSLLFTYVSNGWEWKVLILSLSNPQGMKFCVNVSQSSICRGLPVHYIFLLHSCMSMFLLFIVPTFSTSLLWSVFLSSEHLFWMNIIQSSSSTNVWDTTHVIHFHMVIGCTLYVMSHFLQPTTLLEVVLNFFI